MGLMSHFPVLQAAPPSSAPEKDTSNPEKDTSTPWWVWLVIVLLFVGGGLAFSKSK